MLEGGPAHRGMAMRLAMPDSSPFGSRQKPRSGKDCVIRVYKWHRQEMEALRPSEERSCFYK
jgi:hypothetical protein